MGHSKDGILAITGFQSRRFDREFVVEELSKRIDNPKESKEFEFIQMGLRGAPEIFKDGGHLTTTYNDRRYSLAYDNKRCIINGPGLKDSTP